MARLDKDRQARLEPRRLNKAVAEITKLGFSVVVKDGNKALFLFKEQVVTYFVYSGWATGKTITDGRGLDNLLKQLKDEN